MTMNKPIIVLLTLAGILLLVAFTSTKTTAFRQSPFLARPPPESSGGHALGADPHLDARLALAERLWQQAVEDRKEMVKSSGLDKQFPDGYIRPYHVWDFARPSFFCPHDLERVGTLGDGGKVVCGMSAYERASPGPSSDTNPAQELVVYSFGVNRDSSFEAALLERTNAQIWGYDFSVDSWAKHIPDSMASRAHFTKAGIGKAGGDKTKTPPFYSVHELMEMNGHDYVDIMKMDIEGAEFDAMADLVSVVKGEFADRYNGTLPLGQLLVEIHLIDGKDAFWTPKDLASFMKWWSSMEELGLRPVNNEENWLGNVMSGKPKFIEYTMINVRNKGKNKLL